MFISHKVLLLFLIQYIYLTNGQDNEEEVDCVCVPYYQCEDGKIITTGEGLLDIRIKTCSGIEVCCQLPDTDDKGGVTSQPPVTEPSHTVPPVIQPVPDGGGNGDDTSLGPILPTVSAGQGCGLRRYPGDANKADNSLRITGLLGFPEETFYGEAPWMVRLLPIVNGQINDSYIMCGGSLLTDTVVITAAHCVHNSNLDELIVRVGEWNVKKTNEPIKHQDLRVSNIVLHPEFNHRNLANDIALIGLQSSVKLSQTVDIVCIPDNPVNTSACLATGWGKNDLSRNGDYQDILRKVSLPLMDKDECQTKLRKTKLGKYFRLLKGFLCAGGVQDSDTCEGDGGGPLYCPLRSEPNRFAIVGITAWGIDCGKGNPAVFVDVNHYLPWIKKQLS